MNKCDKCEYFRDAFGNFVQCVKTGRFVDYEYWHNQEPEDCPIKDKPPKEKQEMNPTPERFFQFRY